MKITKKIKWISISLIYIGIIFLLSFKHPGIVKHSFIKEILNNLAHIPLYGILGYFLIILFKHLRTGTKAFMYTIVCGMSIAGFDEFFQSFIPGRTVSNMDLMLDLTGICLGIIVVNITRIINKQHKKRLKLREA
ncbi:MAG: VanZ family protein [Candidatus Pacebacteria bacterium]|nr:VanZ family protein [Candidatus Paceibacterota bacterium]